MQVRVQKFEVGYEYPVVFSTRVFSPDNPALRQALGPVAGGPHRALVLVDSGVAAAQPALPHEIEVHAAVARDAITLVRAPEVIEGGEACKNDPYAIERIQRLILRHGIDRHAFLIGIGGGALLDLVGYAAATAHRGVRLVRVPTTTLSQGDSAVGVKCAVNAHGVKNLVGAFAPPHAVLIDSSFLGTLPRRDLVAGLAEAVKVALVRDGRLFTWMEQHACALADGRSAPVAEVVRRSAELHLDHIARGGDPFERGRARPLDFGHWAAHRLESLTGHRLRHGEAVAIGMALDVHLSMSARLADEATVNRVVTLLEALGLPTWDEALTLRHGGRLAVLEGLEQFRQHLGGALCVTLLDRIGRGVDVGTIPTAHVEAAVRWLETRQGEGRRVAG